MEETHKCATCGKSLIRKLGETPSRYKERKYCSKDCSSKRVIPIKDVKPNMCQQCGGLIKKRSTESVNRYYSRKFCSQKCTKIYLKEHELGWYANGSMKFSYKEKKKEDDLPPIIWTDSEFKEFYNQYPELTQF